VKKFLYILILVTALTSCGGEDRETDEVTTATWEQGDDLVPIAVEVLEVSRGRLVPYVEASGIIQGIKEAWVVSETQGPITQVSASLGQKVKKGELLLSVKNDLQRLNRDLALQQYQSAQLDFEGIEKTFKNGGLSRSDYNSARTRLLQSRASYESSLKAFEDTLIRAPFDGTIALLENTLTEGAFLSPSSRIALIIDTSQMKMEVALGERQVDLITPGQTVDLEIMSLNNREPIQATIEAVGAGSVTTTGSYPVIITWENTENGSIRSGLSARAIMKNSREEDKIIIPSTALIVRDRKASVIVAEEGRTRIKEVDPGDSLGGNTIITSGLEGGELLIVSALSALGDNYPIEISPIGKTGDWR